MLERVVFSPSHSKCLAVKSAGGQETARDSSVSLNLKVRDRKKGEKTETDMQKEREKEQAREGQKKERSLEEVLEADPSL